MNLPLKVRSTTDGQDCPFSLYQLQKLAAALYIELPEGIRMVQYSELPPSCTDLPWQPTDGCGGNPIGRVKHFKEGSWQ